MASARPPAWDWDSASPHSAGSELAARASAGNHFGPPGHPKAALRPRSNSNSASRRPTQLCGRGQASKRGGGQSGCLEGLMQSLEQGLGVEVGTKQNVFSLVSRVLSSTYTRWGFRSIIVLHRFTRFHY